MTSASPSESKQVNHLRKNLAMRKRLDLGFGVMGLLALSAALISLLGLFLHLAMDGADKLQPHFFTNFPSRFADKAGILSAWVGSSLVMFTTACVGIPLGIASGVYLEEYAPRNKITSFIEINIMNLAGVPSIVYGLMALGLFVYQFRLGQSILTAGLTLALLTLPIIITSTREAIRTIPNHMREAAYALGASKFEVVTDHVLPYSMSGILTGTVIALSRAVGETAPLITIGALSFIAYLPQSPFQSNAPFFNFSWLMDGFTVLPVQMFNWVSRPQEEFHLNAAAVGMVLLAFTLLMNGAAIWLRIKFRRSVRW
jgi:phosphate transport system permease protein